MLLELQCFLFPFGASLAIDRHPGACPSSAFIRHVTEHLRLRTLALFPSLVGKGVILAMPLESLWRDPAVTLGSTRMYTKGFFVLLSVEYKRKQKPGET